LAYCDLATGECRPGCATDDQCPSNERCELSDHECVCVDGYHRCSGVCVSDSAVTSCGSSCDPCPTDPNGEASCVGGACDLRCNSGYHMCDELCVPNDSLDSCGDRCEPCPTAPNAEATCDGTRCGFACEDGHHDCDGDCVTNDSPDHCGSSCDPCPTDPNGTATCDGSVCGMECSGEYTEIDGVCCLVDDYEPNDDDTERTELLVAEGDGVVCLSGLNVCSTNSDWFYAALDPDGTSFDSMSLYVSISDAPDDAVTTITYRELRYDTEDTIETITGTDTFYVIYHINTLCSWSCSTEDADITVSTDSPVPVTYRICGEVEPG
jgi:hypothetical protein